MAENKKALDVQNSQLILNLKQILHEKALHQATTDTHLRPVIPLIPSSDVFKSNGITAGGTVNVYTTPTNQEFYLTYANFSYSKDATCDAATGQLSLTAVIGGLVTNILNFSVITLTAQDGNISASFPYPIKIDKGTNIAIANSTVTAGLIRRSATIGGFLV